MPKKIIITCTYCDRYRTLTRKGDGSKYCTEEKEDITSDTEICEDSFVPTTLMYCLKASYWIDTVVCMNRYKKRVYGCKTCKQGKIIRKIKEQFIDDN